MTFHERLRRPLAARSALALGLALGLAGLGPVSGCGGSDGHNPEGSPIVQPDSEPGKKAIAESETLLRLRKKEESRARTRLRVMPEEG